MSDVTYSVLNVADEQLDGLLVETARRAALRDLERSRTVPLLLSKRLRRLYESVSEEDIESLSEQGIAPTSDVLLEVAKGKLEAEKLEVKERIRGLAVAAASDISLAKNVELHCCSCEDLLSYVDVGSVDAIITDPPYEKAGIPVYKQLADLAAQVLKPGGSLVVMTGQRFIPEWLQQMEHPDLEYLWTACLEMKRPTDIKHPAFINSRWKPLFWYRRKGKGLKKPVLSPDVISSVENLDEQGKFHKWGQSVPLMVKIVEQFVAEPGLICDPFLGAGSTGVAAVSLGHRFVGCDVDENSVKISTVRLGDPEMFADICQENVASDRQTALF